MKTVLRFVLKNIFLESMSPTFEEQHVKTLVKSTPWLELKQSYEIYLRRAMIF